MDTPPPTAVTEDDLPSPAAEIETPADRPLDPRYVPVQRIGGLFSTAVVAMASAFGIGAIWLATPVPPWLLQLLIALWPLAVGATALWSFNWPAVAYRHTSYRLDDEGLTIRTGVLWRVVIHVPRSRVQHTDVAQGPVERRFGIGTLVVYTAGTAHARVVLPGLDHGEASRIRDRLLPPDDSDAL